MTGCIRTGATSMPASAVKMTSDMTRGFSNATKSPGAPPAMSAASALCSVAVTSLMP